MARADLWIAELCTSAGLKQRKNSFGTRTMQLKCSGFNDVFLNFKAKSMHGLDAGNGDIRL